MSLTISELEEQRAKILREIESKAGKISPSNSLNDKTPSLNDWLNAAEEVMPEKPQSASNQSSQKTSYSNKMLANSKSSNRTSFFGVIIMLSLFLTILGVLYIAYSSIHKELQNVLVVKEENMEQVRLLQADMQSLEQTVTTGGKTQLFNELELKVIALQTEVNELKAIIAGNSEISSNFTDKTIDSTLSNTDSEKNDSELQTVDEVNPLEKIFTGNANKVVTEGVLDKKLRNYTQQLEQKIDRKLEIILQHLIKDSPDRKLPGLVEPNTSEQTQEIETPVVETVKTPVVNEPLLKLVGEVSRPKAPTAPDAPLVNATSDVRWLIAQPKAHYILQLASMPNEAGAQQIIKSNQLQDAKLIPQTRNNATNYILVTGSFANRNDADSLAKEVKSKYGISAWIRQVKDLTNRIQ